MYCDIAPAFHWTRTFGAADLTIQVRNKGVDASFTSDNRGNKFIGPYQEQLTLTERPGIP